MYCVYQLAVSRIGSRLGFLECMAARDRYRVNTWYDVPVKKGNNNNINRQSNVQGDGIKFFVSNLPERCSSSDLKGVLKEYGDVQGIYIARKYDRLGKRFGFATFNVTRNRSELEDSLKDVWIGSYKLFIVPARFVDGQKVSKDKGKEIDRNVHGEKVWKPVSEQDNTMYVDVGIESDNMQIDKNQSASADQRTFKDTLLNKVIDLPIPELVVDSEGKMFEEYYDMGLVARVVKFSILTSLRGLVKEVYKGRFSIKYVGGLYVLIVFDSIVERESFMGLRELWKDLFNSVENWAGQSLVVNRLAWIKIFGVPIHLAEPKVFDAIASKFGEVFQLAQFLEEGDVSCALVGIVPNNIDRISSICKVGWKQFSYVVLVEEDMGDWVPDCVSDCMEEEEVIDTIRIEEGNGVGNSQVDNVGVEINSTPDVVFVRGVTDERGVKTSKRKGGKYSKKKAAMRRSVSPLDKGRPKKRIREDNDIFDIDRLIFLNQDNSNNQEDMVEDFVTPDLNVNVVSAGSFMRFRIMLKYQS
uniref:Putative nucleotide-binding alpha-beta plait domain-containing protein n=1 Tax=Helianthus annuus TaxID=4232 RepID=A0A251UF16_HELAN